MSPKTTAARARSRPKPRKVNAGKVILRFAKGVHGDVKKQRRPHLNFPLRSLSNVHYSPKTGTFVIGDRVSTRDLSYTTAKTFAQSIRMLSLSKELVDSSRSATKREAYYVSKNWEDAKFDEQPESDTVMDDMEAMLGVNREQLGFIPEEHGGSVVGSLIVVDRDRSTNRPLRIDCTKQGSGAWSVPSKVEHLKFKTKAKFVLAIETGGMFQRLVEEAYWKKANCILVAMGGVPSRACRRFIRKLSDDQKLPVYVFTDGDPYGYSNIYRTLKVGSGNSAHLNEFFCVPKAKFLGVTPKDIIDYDLPTHALKDVDIKRAKDAIKNDPFFQHHKQWRKALEQMIKMGKRVEQQAFAKHGLDFVIKKYLPAKLKAISKFLP
ncbi:MAG: DNA topoisomerase IV subunit A [Planctomycetota bacterium]|jgi:DNA topoisomerase-6 subunit A